MENKAAKILIIIHGVVSTLSLIAGVCMFGRLCESNDLSGIFCLFLLVILLIGIGVVYFIWSIPAIVVAIRTKMRNPVSDKSTSTLITLIVCTLIMIVGVVVSFFGGTPGMLVGIGVLVISQIISIISTIIFIVKGGLKFGRRLDTEKDDGYVNLSLNNTGSGSDKPYKQD